MPGQCCTASAVHCTGCSSSDRPGLCPAVRRRRHLQHRRRELAATRLVHDQQHVRDGDEVIVRQRRCILAKDKILHEHIATDISAACCLRDNGRWPVPPGLPICTTTVKAPDSMRELNACHLADPVQAEHVSMCMPHLLLLAHDGDPLPISSCCLRLRCARPAVCCRRRSISDIITRAAGGRRCPLRRNTACGPAETAQTIGKHHANRHGKQAYGSLVA